MITLVADIYKMKAVLFRGTPEDKFLAYVHKYLDQNASLHPHQIGKFYWCPGQVSAIWTRNKSVAILAHEILHLSLYMLKTRNISITEESEEVLTYLFEHLLQQALQEKVQ